MEDETPAIEAARRTCFFAQSAFRRGNGRSSGIAARIAPSPFRPGDERILREGQSCEQRPAGQLRRRSGAPAEAMAGRGAFLCRLPFGAGMAADLATRGIAARIAPSLFRPGDERSLREGQSCEQRPAGQPRRSGAPAEPMAGSALLRRVCFRRGNGRSSGIAARLAPSLLRPGYERSLREGQSCEQRPAGRLRRSGAPAEPMAGRGRAFAVGLLQARDWPQTWQCGKDCGASSRWRSELRGGSSAS